MPSAVTVDIGLLRNPDTGQERWAVVEANMPWFPHSYAASPDAVLRAVGPRDQVALADCPFLRPTGRLTDPPPPRRDSCRP
ncbi:hypothetical protein ACWGCW_23170 [Streptomyces sp. NPDC054933]